MEDEDKQITRKELIAFGVGLTVTIVSTVLTAPIGLPLSILVGVGMGGAAGYGTLKVLDPRTRQDLEKEQTDSEYRQMLSEYRQMLHEISAIAVRTGQASQSLRPVSPEISERLANIARITEMIVVRYRERRRDFADASATLIILQTFEDVLAQYLKVKKGELFVDGDQKEKEIAETEMRVIPMVEIALENLGEKLDAGVVLDTNISKGTLESMLWSLDLIKYKSDQVGADEKGKS
jgi:hypothetical protein